MTTTTILLTLAFSLTLGWALAGLALTARRSLLAALLRRGSKGRKLWWLLATDSEIAALRDGE